VNLISFDNVKRFLLEHVERTYCNERSVCVCVCVCVCVNVISHLFSTKSQAVLGTRLECDSGGLK